MNILDFLGKKKGSNFIQILDSLRVKNGIVSIRVSGFTHTFEAINCKFINKNSPFNSFKARVEIAPFLID